MRRISDRASTARALDRRRLRDGALAVLVPVVACCTALAGLTVWVGAGRAGSPARIRVTQGRVLLPSAGAPETAAFFRVANEGGSADTLLRIAARDVPGAVTLSRHCMRPGNAAYRSPIDSVAVAAGEGLAMSPTGIDLTVPVPSKAWHAGDRVPFTLEFRRGGPVRVLAVVVRPGTVTLP
ncbi:copper chaperone PCu(A)C [Streptomyces sp. LaBMicrA B280]|uniref:copper chaperone PCu(A)C n=1 Tax=Streptomyces sp. LaBMicrA B280 TaxID=3391001 RepID=UPI003BA5DC23